jgi:hypothetical protein
MSAGHVRPKPGGVLSRVDPAFLPCESATIRVGIQDERIQKLRAAGGTKTREFLYQFSNREVVLKISI